MEFDINKAIKYLCKRRDLLKKRLEVVHDFLEYLEQQKRQESKEKCLE